MKEWLWLSIVISGEKISSICFCMEVVVINGKKYQIGEGEPVFTVIFHKDIRLSALTTSTSIALGEAYMNRDLEVEGNLYFALDHFLGQMGKFSTDESALAGELVRL